MISRLLIANRGEIACRVIRTARSMGITSIAVYSDADANALHVQLADEAVHIGAAPPEASYLNIDAILNAAAHTGADAIHPGYGFLSENPEFCRACTQAGIVFVGPPEKAIAAMGSKSAAKRIMAQAGVPLLPGYHEASQDENILRAAAVDIGFPVLLKAVAGGGGKGMRVVDNADDFSEALKAARREALNGFGDEAMLVEKYLMQPRHVEVQVFFDLHGNGVYLFERDCSVQRRHQKVIEEAPAPGLTGELRVSMGETAVQAAAAVDYVGAGTVEFLLEPDGNFYFMEMNTRLQVEHPVTEMVTGQDLVAWQLKVAMGERLPLMQHDLKLSGHAIEARIYAEDPGNDFLPAAGVIGFLREPPVTADLRVDAGVKQGDEVGVFYDPMIAKLIAFGADREQARQRLIAALSGYQLAGFRTNVDFLGRVLRHEAFIDEALSTSFIAQHGQSLQAPGQALLPHRLPIAALYIILGMRQSGSAVGPVSPWDNHDHFRVNHALTMSLDVFLEDTSHSVSVVHLGEGVYRIETSEGIVTASGELADELITVSIDGRQFKLTVFAGDNLGDNDVTAFDDTGSWVFSEVRANLGAAEQLLGSFDFRAPMNGTIIDVPVQIGALVEAGQTLLVMEAMKMEHAVKAPVAGVVTEFYFSPGDLVDGSARLLAFEPVESS